MNGRIFALALAFAAGFQTTVWGGVDLVGDLIERAKSHPCLLVTPARVVEIKARLASDKQAQGVWKSLVGALDKKLAQPLDIPDRGGQWCHYYFCRKCATGLKAKSPTEHVCPHCGEMHTGWPYDDFYLMQVHYANADQMHHAAFAYQITGDARYARRAKEILLAYAAVYETYPLHDLKGPSKSGSAGRFGPQTLEESAILGLCAQAYDMIYDRLTEAERATIVAKLLVPSAHTVHKIKRSIGNWECWHLSAYGQAGLMAGDRELVADAVTGPCGYLQQLEKAVFDDGVWNECGWGYQFYTMSGLARIVMALNNLGVPPPERYKRMFDAAFGQVMPDWCFAAMNDSGRHSLRGQCALYEYGWTFWKDPVYAWWLSQNKRNSPQSLFVGSALPGTVDNLSRLSSRVYPNGGIAILRSSAPDDNGPMPGNFIALDFGPHGGWHGHPDKLALTLYARGQLLAEDPGSVGYSNARQWGWYRATLSHNTLVQNGRNQAYTTGSCEAFAAKGNASVISLDAGGAYADAKVGRLVALVDDVVLDYMWVHGDKPHSYEWAFHSRGEMTSPLSFTPITLPPVSNATKIDKGSSTGMDTQNDGNQAWSWTRQNAEAPHDGVWSAKWVCGKATLNLVQKAPAGVIRTGKGSAQPASKEFTLAVNRVTAPLTTAGFATVLTVDGTSEIAIERVIAEPDGTEGFVALVKGRRFTVVRTPSGRFQGHAAKAVLLVEDAAGKPEVELSAVAL